MGTILLTVILVTVLFLTGLLQALLEWQEKRREGQYGKQYWGLRKVLLVLLVIAYIGTLIQSFESDHEKRVLIDKANESLKLSGENKSLSNENKNLLLETKKLAQGIIVKNEDIVDLNKKVASQAERIAEMAKMSTGGDAYCFIDPSIEHSRLKFLLMLRGNYPLYDVELIITDEKKLATLPFDEITKPLSDLYKKEFPQKEEWDKIHEETDFFTEFNKLRAQAQTRIEIPVLHPRRVQIFGPYKIPDGLDELEFSIDIYARNIHISEEIRSLRIKGKWKDSFRVIKNELDGKKKIILEVIDKEVPLKSRYLNIQ